MSMLRNEQEAQQEQRESSAESSSSSLSSTSNSISLIKLDELSSFGATKQSRLPALIKLNPLADQNSRELLQQPQPQQGSSSSNSMPDFSGSQVEKMVVSETTPGGATITGQQSQQSLPVDLQQVLANKENTVKAAPQAASSPQEQATSKPNQDDSVDDFQVVEMEQMNTLDGQMAGPSLPQQVAAVNAPQKEMSSVSNDNNSKQQLFDKSVAAASLNSQRGEQYASHLGDSLIEMIINLRNENQNLIKALEVNNGYVKERLDEFKRCQEEAKKRESEHQMEKTELEHNLRKVQRQNGVLSERLKSMELKLKEMKLEVSGTLSAAHSSKASSVHDSEPNLYPQLGESNSFGNSALQKATEEAGATMQVDAASGELYNDGDHQSRSSAAAEMDTSDQQTAAKVAGMSREELSRRFDAKKVDFYAIDDPMKQCDQLEQQLNDIGKRDYEICLLQQQLNIYRQDFRLERMAKLEAKIQIEKLKNEIDRLCLDRLTRANEEDQTDDDQPQQQQGHNDGLIGKLGHHLSRKALKSAAKAAKYASKQAHLEEKAAAALARAAAAKAGAASHFAPTPAASASSAEGSGAEQAQGPHHHHHHSRRHHRHHHHAPPHPPHHRQSGGRSIRGEIVSDLMSTANKAMLTGYNLASTTINSALDKLSQFEQQQAAQAADPNRPRPGYPYPTPGGAQQQSATPSAPPMDSHLSVD